MARYRKKRAPDIGDLIKPIVGLLALGLFFIPGFGTMLLAIGILAASGGTLYLAFKWFNKQEQKNHAIYASKPNIDSSLETALKTANDAGVTIFNDKEKPVRPRYTTAESLITKGEKEFYDTLRKAVPEAAIHTKVRVSDVIQHTTGFIGDFRRVSQFHFDWVICDPNTSKPILAIELDDSSHRRWRNKRNDQTKDQAAKEANFPILRFPWAQTYNEEEIRGKIATIVNRVADEFERGSSLLKEKKCPRCSGKIVERTAKSSGKKFLGCSEFPKCRHIENIG